VPWLDDLVTLVEDAHVATYGVDLFISTKASPPLLASGTLSIVETSGSAPERTQNAVVRPAYIRPAAQFMARADTYERAREIARGAYNAVVGLRNSWVIAAREYEPGAGLRSGWYREITPLQEPFDAGVDDRKQARCGFNVIGVRRPDAN
jgi:hypothetical protein